MPDLIFCGASDDLIEVDGVFKEEYNAERKHFLVVAPDGRQGHVRVVFEANGCWSVAYWPEDEDAEGFTGRVRQERYSATLFLDVAEGTKVHVLADERKLTDE